jgi:hypothetical protein
MDTTKRYCDPPEDVKEKVRKLWICRWYPDIIVYNTYKLYHSLTLLLLLKATWERHLQNTSKNPFRKKIRDLYTGLINFICDTLVTGPKWLFTQLPEEMTSFPVQENGAKICMGKGMEIAKSDVKKCWGKLEQAEREGERKSFNVHFRGNAGREFMGQFRRIHTEVFFSLGTHLDMYALTSVLMPFITILFWIRQILRNIHSNCCKVLTEEDQSCINPDMVKGLLDHFDQTIHAQVLLFINEHTGAGHEEESSCYNFMMDNCMIGISPPPCEAQRRLKKLWFDAVSIVLYDERFPGAESSESV